MQGPGMYALHTINAAFEFHNSPLKKTLLPPFINVNFKEVGRLKEKKSSYVTFAKGLKV